MTVHALLFEAESIQAYITDSGQLTDAVGASVRVDQLCGDLVTAADAPADLLSAVLGAAGVSPGSESVRFSRRGGGAFIALFDDRALRDRVQALWSAALGEVAPGLRFGLAAVSGAHDLAAAETGMQALRALRNLPDPLLPEPGPLTRRATRTGRAAVRKTDKGGNAEWVDAQTAIHRGYHYRADTHDRLTERFGLENSLWPRNLEEDFPFLDNGHREVAMVHADGNGLGVALQRLADACRKEPGGYVKAYAGFSRAVTQATRRAAEQATRTVLEPATAQDATGRVPARPLVLGGDDLTILLRPDVAVPFTEAFLHEFSRATRDTLAPLRRDYPFLPERLTAAAGIAIVHASHPFDRAMYLAEALCKEVKRHTKRLAAGHGPAPSGLMFYRQTVSLLDDWEQVEQAETTPWHGTVRYRTVHGPYLLEPDALGRLPSLAALRALRDVLESDVMARGPMRQLITQLHHAPETALKSWRRVWEMLEQRAPSMQGQLAAALQGLSLPAEPDVLPCALRPATDTQGAAPAADAGTPPRLLHTPLGDALTLAHLQEWSASPEKETCR